MSFRHSEAFEAKLGRLSSGACPHCGATGNWLVDDQDAPYCFHCSCEVYQDGAVAPDGGCSKTFRDRGCRAAESCLQCPFKVCAEEEAVHV